MLTTVHRECRATSPFPVAARGARSLRGGITLTISGRSLMSKGRVFFSQAAHLCTLTCCAARPRLGSSRRGGHKASRARAAEGRPSTRWLGSQSSRPRGSGRILLASIRGRVLYEIRPEEIRNVSLLIEYHWYYIISINLSYYLSITFDL